MPSTLLAPRRGNQPLTPAQTAHLAHTTRRKLSTAASRADHDLRVLVGHANFLDSLLLQLAEAHWDQEYGPSPAVVAPQRVEEPKRRANIVDSVGANKPVDDWEVWESDGSESDSSDIDSCDDGGESNGAAMTTTSMTTGEVMVRLGLARAGKLAVVAREVGEDDDDDDDGYGDLGLVRTLSHSPPRFLGDPFA